MRTMASLRSRSGGQEYPRAHNSRKPYIKMITDLARGTCANNDSRRRLNEVATTVTLFSNRNASLYQGIVYLLNRSSSVTRIGPPTLLCRGRQATRHSGDICIPRTNNRSPWSYPMNKQPMKDAGRLVSHQNATDCLIISSLIISPSFPKCYEC